MQKCIFYESAVLCIKRPHNERDIAMTQQIELFDIASPCVSVCTSNKKGYCFGCLRSLTERQLWLGMTDKQPREVLKLRLGREWRIQQMNQLKG